VRGIADTGFIVAFLNRNDAHHDWAVDVARHVTEPLLTCEAVLAETAFHLENVAMTLALISEGLISLAFTCADHLPQLAALAKRYADRKPDLADLCLVRMSELFPQHSVVTIDREDFRVYRRNKRETIPLLWPPEK
jgi:predicted nucleic acid-binding protein